MRIYFSAEKPCALRLGGAAAGFCGEAAKFADVGEEGVQAEFLPMDGDLMPLTFFIGKELFEAPPACCEVHRYCCGAEVFARFSARETPLAVLAQARAGSVLLTAFTCGVPSLVLENGKDMQTFALPRADRYEAGEERIGRELFARLTCERGREKLLLLFNQELEEVFRGRADEYTCGEKLRVNRRLGDIAGHEEECVYRAQGGALVQEQRQVRARERFDPAKLDERILPFAFFQEILAGGEVKRYLAPELAERAGMLRSYLGDFCAVSLPRDIFYLTYGKINAAALSYRRAENAYDVKFFAAACEGGKVRNISPVPAEQA